MKRRVFLGAMAAIAVSGVADAQEKAAKKAVVKSDVKAIAIEHATVHTGAGEVIEDATVVLENGLVTDVAKGLAAPAGAEIIDAKGLVVTPGLVDVVTSIGAVDVDLEEETHDDRGPKTERNNAAYRVADGYNPDSVVIPIARAGGLTSAGVVPRFGVFAGQSAWVDLDGATAAEAIVRAPLALHVNLDATAAGGGGHAQVFLRVREAFDDARSYAKDKAGWLKNQSRTAVTSRLDLEAIASALDKKLIVAFHVNRAADILTALKVANEFKLQPVIVGGAEAWRVASDLAAAKVPVVVFPLESGPSSFDALGARDDDAARLVKAGVAVSISSDDTYNARKLRQVAGNAVRAGMPYESAIRAITSAPAEAFGLGAKVGTLKKGKVANVVVWTGDPLELSTQPSLVIIRGKKASLRTRQTELFEKYRKLETRKTHEPIQ